MKLQDLLKGLEIQNRESIPDISIDHLAYDSRKVTPGSLFAAIPGFKRDGAEFIPEAIGRGAVAVLSEKDGGAPLPAPVFIVPNVRRALARVSARFYGNPSAHFPVVGVTGTNGKTTITYLLESVLKVAGRSPAVIGTVNYRHGAKVYSASHTTPESSDLQSLLKVMREEGADALVMEVSSHALDLHRADGVQFDTAVFTNLTPEHLDYHRDMEDYFLAKRKLFEELLTRSEKREKTAIINVDDAYGERLAAALSSKKILTYSQTGKKGAALFPLSQTLSLGGIEARIQTPEGLLSISSPLLGAFNLSNLLASAGAALSLGLDLKTTETGLKGVPKVPGRLERVTNDRGLHIFVDYAHTPDALKNVVSALRSLLKSPGRLIAVFGCGGDRDRSKRPLMGTEVARGADRAWVTSDNPRMEDPKAILNEILPGLLAEGWREGREFQVEPDRALAIAQALAEAKAGDVVLIAGKGHEDYQIVGNQKFHFDDRETAAEALAAIKEKGFKGR